MNNTFSHNQLVNYMRNIFPDLTLNVEQTIFEIIDCVKLKMQLIEEQNVLYNQENQLQLNQLDQLNVRHNDLVASQEKYLQQINIQKQIEIDNINEQQNSLLNHYQKQSQQQLQHSLQMNQLNNQATKSSELNNSKQLINNLNTALQDQRQKNKEYQNNICDMNSIIVQQKSQIRQLQQDQSTKVSDQQQLLDEKQQQINYCQSLIETLQTQLTKDANKKENQILSATHLQQQETLIKHLNQQLLEQQQNKEHFTKFLQTINQKIYEVNDFEQSGHESLEKLILSSLDQLIQKYLGDKQILQLICQEFGFDQYSDLKQQILDFCCLFKRRYLTKK